MDGKTSQDESDPNTESSIGHRVGENNVAVLGFDLHVPVFPISAALILSFAVGTLVFPEKASELLGGTKGLVLRHFDWLFVIATNAVLLFCAVVAVSPLGRIRLGGASAKPEFGVLSWLSMLFSAGVGIGMIFYGAAEPTAYYTDWFGTPLGAEPFSDAAERLAFSATIFHWGFAPWAVYAVVGLALAFFAFNRGLPLTIRSIFHPLLGERVWGWRGDIIDLIAVLATIFGLATSLGLGAMQATSGLNYLFGIPASVSTQVVLIAGITFLATLSVVRGLDGGIRLLSNVNMILAIALLLFVVVAGPTLRIAESYLSNTIAYIADMPRLSNWMDRGDRDWFHGWTIFYWAWWISWSPFVGMFIARVSKGRTVRQFLCAVLIVPTLAAIVWFSSFGGAALDQVQNGVGELQSGITEVPLVLFQMLANLPYSRIVSFLAIALLIVFFVTSSDSGSLVIDSITAGGKLHAPVSQRVFWATMEGLLAAVLLIGGGSRALSALQSGAIATGLPFTVILLACCYSLMRGLMDELRTGTSVDLD